MYPIVRKEVLADKIFLMEVKAERCAKSCLPGQFIIVKTDEKGERIPLTICDYDREKGTVTIIFQKVGKSTKELGMLSAGDSILDFVGPLGTASHLEGLKKVAVIGGGLGTAIAYPQAKELSRLGAEVHSVIGFRNKDLIILEDKVKAVSAKTMVMTDDGSNGNQGFVTNALKELIDSGENYDMVIAIGPLIMMKMVCELTRPYGIKTIVSMNPVMIDGTGMCGGCRVTVGGETKFACVDGPDFDGHLVDFDLAMRRQQMFKKQEREADCRLMGGLQNA